MVLWRALPDCLAKALDARKKNAAWLRQTTAAIGAEVEAWPYEKLNQPAERLSFCRIYDGKEVTFSLEPFDMNEQGDLHICIDVSADVPVFPYLSPSYVFWKKKDVTISYA